jgi:hypothetical protein
MPMSSNARPEHATLLYAQITMRILLCGPEVSRLIRR